MEEDMNAHIEALERKCEELRGRAETWEAAYMRLLELLEREDQHKPLTWVVDEKNTVYLDGERVPTMKLVS